jgi:hypothetical protein
MKILKKIKKIFKKEEIPPYPRDFAIIDYSPTAKNEGVINDQNKIVTRFYFDEDGNRKTKKYRYSFALIHSLMEVYEIPILDKTKKKEILPIYSTVLPSEVKFKE